MAKDYPILPALTNIIKPHNSCCFMLVINTQMSWRLWPLKPSCPSEGSGTELLVDRHPAGKHHLQRCKGSAWFFHSLWNQEMLWICINLCINQSKCRSSFGSAKKYIQMILKSWSCFCCQVDTCDLHVAVYDIMRVQRTCLTSCTFTYTVEDHRMSEAKLTTLWRQLRCQCPKLLTTWNSE